MHYACLETQSDFIFRIQWISDIILSDLQMLLGFNIFLPDETVKCAVLFLARGKAMSKSRIKLLSASIMKNEDVEVLERFDSQRPPTHIVVDATISVNDLSSSLGFLSLAVMAKVFEKVRCLFSCNFLLFLELDVMSVIHILSCIGRYT